MTRAAIMRILKHRYPKQRVGVQEYPNALSDAEKAKVRALNDQRRARTKEIDAELGSIGPQVLERLTKAARFVVDVAAGEPSLSELAAMVKTAERHLDLRQERRDLEQIMRKDAGRCHTSRFSAYGDDLVCGIGMRMIHAEAQTLGELLTKLEGAKR